MSQNATRNSSKGGFGNSSSGRVASSKTTSSYNNNSNSNNINESNSKFQKDTLNNKNTTNQNHHTGSSNSQTHTTNHKLLNNNSSNSLDENHNNKHVDKEHGAHLVKATAEQMRLASLISKSDDPETNSKVKQLSDMFPLNKQDDIVMVLHECDYDLAKATNMLADGLSSFQDDWITAGTKKKPTPSSPNQANDEADVHPQNRSQHKPNGGLGKEKRQNRGDRDRDRDRERKGGSNNKKENAAQRPRKTDSNADSNLEDKFNNLDIKDGESKFNNFSNGDDQPNDHQHNNRNNKRNSGGRGGGGRGPGSVANRGGRNNGFGGERKTRENRGPRSDNRRSFNNRDQNPQTDEILGAGEGVELVVVSKTIETSSFESSNVVNNASVIAPVINSEKTKLNELIETAKTSNSDNLRDIGTWTNEQADRNKSHNRQQRFNANKQSGGAMNANKSVEDWENEEEWQGDLTKTQIFTSSNQKKDNVETKPFNSNFPIGHFNAEEATQNIKKAVGIGTISTTKPMTNDAPTPAAQPAAPVHKDVVSRAPAVTQPQPPAPAKLVNKISSAKIPPPSTKIPKSAVIMPDGTSNSTSFNLDVQFGVDLDTPIQTDAKPAVQPQRAAPAVTMPIQPAVQQQPQPAQQLKPQQPLGISNQMGGVKGVLNADQSIVSVGSSGAPQVNKSVDAQNLATKTNQLNNSVQQSQPQTQQQPQAHHQTSIGAQNLKLNQDNSNYNESKQKIQNFMPLNKQQQQPQTQQQPQQQSQQFNINQLKQQQQNESNILHQSQAQQNQQQQPLPQRDSHHGQHHHNQPSSNSSSSLQQNGQLNNSASVKQQQQPQNSQSLAASNNVQLGQQQQNAIAQLQQLNQNNSSNANSNSNNQQQQISLSSIQNPVNAAGASVAANAKQSTMAPPPGVNMVNPNNQFLMSLPFVCYDQQNFSYFDPSQMDTSLMQMYNHLTSMPPPGVSGTAGNSTSGPQYPIPDSTFNRNENNNANSQLNATAAQLSQQQQQQQPINLIPNLSNFPFFFPNYYPNMFMSVPNGPQGNPQQFQNKLPYNFNNNNAGYDDQAKDYNNYNPQNQIKSAGLNSNNVSEISGVSGYQKNVNVDKSNTGYHTPPPNFSNSLLNQPPHVNPNNAGGPQQQPPTQYAYITSMMGQPGGNMVHTGIQQDNLNSRNVGNAGNSNNIKPLQKGNYNQKSTW